MVTLATQTSRSLPASPLRSARALLAPLLTASKLSDRLVAHSIGEFACAGERHPLTRFIFDGPRGGGDPIRLAIFAGIHGDEPAGVVALAQFLIELAAQPDLAKGYRIFAYPIINPTGYEANTRHSAAGVDLNREFWRGSPQPEVQLLEAELTRHEFHGIVALHSDDTSPGVYGFTRGPDLSKDLLEPALWAAEKFFRRNTDGVIDGFRARRGLIDGGYEGILSAPADQQPAPFEIVFETPALAPLPLQVAATNAALRRVLADYRAVISLAQHI